MTIKAYAAELHELNTSARMFKEAAKRSNDVTFMAQCELRLLQAEQATLRAMGLLTSKGRAA